MFWCLLCLKSDFLCPCLPLQWWSSCTARAKMSGCIVTGTWRALVTLQLRSIFPPPISIQKSIVSIPTIKSIWWLQKVEMSFTRLSSNLKVFFTVQLLWWSTGAKMMGIGCTWQVPITLAATYHDLQGCRGQRTLDLNWAQQPAVHVTLFFYENYHP